MAKKKSAEKQSVMPDISISPETRRGILVVFLYALAVLAALSIFNLAGAFGEILDQGLTGLFGWDRVVLPIVLAVFATKILAPEKIQLRTTGSLGLVLLVLVSNGIIEIFTLQISPMDSPDRKSVV